MSQNLVYKKFTVFPIFFVLMFLLFPYSASAELGDIEISEQRLANGVGRPLGDHVNIGQQVVITANVKNNLDTTQEFVYIYQIKDESGQVVEIRWVTGILSPGQSFEPGSSWIPKVAGDYTAEIFVWDSLIDRNALSEFKTLVIVVS